MPEYNYQAYKAPEYKYTPKEVKEERMSFDFKSPEYKLDS